MITLCKATPKLTTCSMLHAANHDSLTNSATTKLPSFIGLHFQDNSLLNRGSRHSADHPFSIWVKPIWHQVNFDALAVFGNKRAPTVQELDMRLTVCHCFQLDVDGAHWLRESVLSAAGTVSELSRLL